MHRYIRATWPNGVGSRAPLLLDPRVDLRWWGTGFKILMWITAYGPHERHALDRCKVRAASDRSNSRRGGFLYSAFAQTFRAFRGINFTTRLRRLFGLLKPRAIAGGANNLSQNFTRSFHRDQ